MYVKNKELISKTLNKITEISLFDIKLIKKIGSTLKKINLSGQSRINNGKNKYILKPHELSRGRGIKTVSNLNDIIKELATKGGSAPNPTRASFVIQKYIENPLLYNNRKFDIRIWTIITSSSPLISWVWQKFYIRLSGCDFDLENDDRFVNLTNFSVQKFNKDRNDECMLD